MAFFVISLGRNVSQSPPLSLPHTHIVVRQQETCVNALAKKTMHNTVPTLPLPCTPPCPRSSPFRRKHMVVGADSRVPRAAPVRARSLENHTLAGRDEGLHRQKGACKTGLGCFKAAAVRPCLATQPGPVQECHRGLRGGKAGRRARDHPVHYRLAAVAICQRSLWDFLRGGRRIRRTMW